MTQQLLAGWAEVDLTPKKKVRLAGQFCERISESVETPIIATALALEFHDDCAILCSCDLVSINSNLLDSVRNKVKETIPDFDVSKLIISATHTHTSIQYTNGSSLSILKKYTPDSIKYQDPLPVRDDLMDDEEALTYLINKLTEVVVKAWKARTPAKLANEFGRAAVGMCRRVTYDDMSAKMWGDTNTANFVALEGGSDTGLELLYFFDQSGMLTGVLANLACPAQSVQHRTFISSDFWGKVRVIVRKEFGENIHILPLCSAAGDQCPVDLIRWVEPQSDLMDPNIIRTNPPIRKADPSMFDIQGSWKAGKRIAHEIIDCFQDAQSEIQEATVFSHYVAKVKLPVRRVSREDRDVAADALERFFSANKGKTLSFYDNASMHVHAGTLARFEYQQKHHVFSIDAHYIRLNRVAFATNPFELFLDYGNQIRAQSPAEQTILIQLANGNFGYLPTKRAEEGSHYSAYISSGITGHEGGDLYVRETLDILENLFN